MRTRLLKKRTYGSAFQFFLHVKFLERNFSDSNTDSTDDASTKFINLNNMNQNIKIMEYAVRGPLMVRAAEIEKELKEGKRKPFKKVIRGNLGDGQAMGQKPITFYRQVMALVARPELMSNKCFPPDTIGRAEKLLAECRGGSIGAYSDSFGIEMIRKDIAEFIKERDNFHSDWKNIVLSSGASDIIKNVIKLMNHIEDGKPSGVMVPIPQYPLYSATLAEFGMHLIGYYLKESENWSLDLEDLQKAFCESMAFCVPRAITVINPGNPTGQVLTKENIENIVKFAYENKLVLLADEVYQTNIYAEDREFHSFKKIIKEMGQPYSNLELASFFSCSKGYMGECGIRGGYCELVNFDPEVLHHFTKSINATLCPTVIGQCLLDCIVKPPVEDEPSFEVYCKEKNEILDSLKTRAKMVSEFFNTLEGFSCNEVQGAMYAFPKIDIPPKAVEEAESKNLPADTFYAFELLENTGICIVPGSGFQQEPGTYHFRSTILPPISQLNEMFEMFKEFQISFLKKYS